MQNVHNTPPKTVMAVSIIAYGIRKRCRKTSQEYLLKCDMDFPQENTQAFYQQNKAFLSDKADTLSAEKMKRVDKIYVQMVPTVIDSSRGYQTRTCDMISDANLRVEISDKQNTI